MTTESYWAVAQTVTKMEHIVRREIEKGGHGAFLPTMARLRMVDGVKYVKETPVIGGYVFFRTRPDDWAGIPDIHGVYRVLKSRVLESEMKRLVLGHACGDFNHTAEPRFTKYYRPDRVKVNSRRKSRKPRASKRARSSAHA